MRYFKGILKEYEFEDEGVVELVLAMYGKMSTEDEITWGPLSDSVQHCDEVWKKIAESRNRDWTSIFPSERGESYFCVIGFH